MRVYQRATAGFRWRARRNGRDDTARTGGSAAISSDHDGGSPSFRRKLCSIVIEWRRGPVVGLRSAAPSVY
jgi:hypothetical protein